MRTRPIFLIILIAMFIIATGGTTNDKPLVKAPKGYSFIPAGQFQANGNTITLQAFFMSAAEITNGQYKEFLDDLQKQNDIASYAIAKIKEENWKSFQFDNSQNYSSWTDYPVVNISKEGAKLYCNWLSKKLDNEYKNKYIFEVRLPTKNEWEWAAYGGLANVSFPWGGPDIINSAGCYPAHFKVLTQPYGPCKVKSYAQNNFGLYDMAGNVAEMVNDHDIVKGGSWNSLGYELKITHDEPYSISPTVGFRPIITFMGKK